MLLRSKESRQAERKAGRKSEFLEFLHSAEGRRAIFELAPDILVSSKLTPILNDVRVQLEALTAGEVERFKLLLERTLKTAEDRFSHEIDQFKLLLERTLKTADEQFFCEIDQFKRHLASTLKAAEDHFANFLCSQEGRRLMLDLLIAALAGGELTPVLDGAEKRLKVLAEEVVATHTARAELSLKQSAEAHAVAMSRAELSLRRAAEAHAAAMSRAELSLKQSAEAHAAVFKRSASEAARDLANQVAHDVQQQLSSYRGAIVEVVQEQLPVMLREEVTMHVRSGPLFSPPCSNRALAAAHGISIREVKRRRRYGYF